MRRQNVAHRVSGGSGEESGRAPERRKIQTGCRPYGAQIAEELIPTAYAVGYILLPLRGSAWVRLRRAITSW